MSRALRTGVLPVLYLLAGCLAAYAVGQLVQSTAPALVVSTAQAQPAGTVTVERVEAAGLDAGRLRVGEKEIGVLATPAAGFSGYERGLIVADRINRRMAGGARPEDFTVARRGDLTVIEAGPNEPVLTVTPDDAKYAATETATLARRWTSALRQGLGGSALEEAPATDVQVERTETTTQQWRPSEPYDDKYVPILSLLQGTRLGVARVNGPRSRVDLTQAVAQFSIDFGSFLEIDIYVPISTREPGKSLSRVQGVGVTGLGDIKL
ncbi:MAG: hypothetical protein ABFE08_14700 [Armatimonadia bacterium]